MSDREQSRENEDSDVSNSVASVGSQRKRGKRKLEMADLNERISKQDERFVSLESKMDTLLASLQPSRDFGAQGRRENHDDMLEEGTLGEPRTCSRTRPFLSIDDGDSNRNADALSIRVGDSEKRDANFSEGRRSFSGSDRSAETHNSMSVMEEDNERFSRYISSKPVDANQNLVDIFGVDAQASKSKSEDGLCLDDSQKKVLSDSWHSKNHSKLSSYRESYRASFPVQEESVDFLQVPTFDDTVESLLVKKHGHKAAFGSTPSLYNRQLRSIEKIGFQGQTAARMGVIMTCYTQKALGILLENLQSENPNIDRAIQTTRDVFAMTTKSLDQVAGAGAFHHMSRRKAAVYDTGLDEYKDYASTIMALPLTSEGVFGSQFDDKLKSKQERFKQIAEVLPELDNSNRNAKSVAGKRKAATSSYSNDKRRRYSNGRPRNSGYSGCYGSGGRSNWSTGRGRGSYRGRGATVSSFRAHTKSS